MDYISSIIKCVNCESTLSSPVLLPCGHSVCKKHTNEDVNSSIRCGNCGEDHSIPAKSFPEIKALSMLIDAEIEKLDFGKLYHNAKSVCKELNDLHVEIEALLKDSNFLIHEQISDLKNKVEIKREEFKLQIDKETDRLMEVVTRYESDFKERSTTSEYIENARSLDVSLKESESRLKHWNDSLNKIFIDESKWKTIIDECHETKKLLSDSFETLKQDLLLNNFNSMESKVNLFLEIDLENIMSFKYTNIDSDIIDNLELEDFGELLEIPIDQKWDLLYRATRDGFKAADFHAKCDGKSKTLVIVKAASENVFGGYTECTWDRSEKAKKGCRDYIFSYRNMLNMNNKLKIKKFHDLYDSIVCSAKYGPVFGNLLDDDSFDFAIAGCSNTNEFSFSNLGHSFKHPYFKRNTVSARSFLAGSRILKCSKSKSFNLYKCFAI